MPVQFLSDAQRESLSRFPGEIPPDDVVTFFTLSESDKDQIPKTSSNYNRLGFALGLCALRYLGFCPDDLTTAPTEVIEYLAYQLGVGSDDINLYGKRYHTRTDHLQKIQHYLEFRKAGSAELDTLADWLTERALEHDKPTLLFQLTCEKLYRDKIIHPRVTIIERMVSTARRRSQKETFNRLKPLLTKQCRALLNSLLIYDDNKKCTLLTWLRQGATSNSALAILATLKKFKFLKQRGIDKWDLSVLNPNRIKFLAQLGRKSTNQALLRAPKERRYPILIAFISQSLIDITDEIIQMYEQCLANSYARARRNLEDFRNSIHRSTNEKVLFFHEIGRIILNSEISNEELRETIYQYMPQEKLHAAVENCEKIFRPLDDSYFDFLALRYGYIRQFAPAFLQAFNFRSNLKEDSLLVALALLRDMNTKGQRKVSEDAPLEFVTGKWHPYVLDREGKINRRYWELCALWELRSSLRSGDIWLDNSRQYANPQSYLIPSERWQDLRSEVCLQTQTHPDGSLRLKERETQLDELLRIIDNKLSQNSLIRIENGRLVISPIKADELTESAEKLGAIITQRLPLIELPELLIEVDSWTQFSTHFTHAGGSESRTKDLLVHLYASILAQACNFGLSKMAYISDLSYRQLAWCSNWYIREETLKSAINTLVNFQFRQPLSHHWGSGTLSSSDGQRFPVSVKTRNATPLPRYFGYGRGLTFYTWTSDQFSQYGTKVIPATVRDATYVLDEILDNETELPIVEHTTDTAGYTELIFALFDLLGLQFSPRIRDISDQRLFRIDRSITYPNVEPLLKGTINRSRILKHWDDLLRVAGSLKLGWVTASLLISKLQSYPQQNALTRSLQEYGRLIKTIFILRYLESRQFRKKINLQLNKGEALHFLRQFIFFANEGKIRRNQEEDQTNQASCLNLVTNAVVTWNTVYMTAVIEQLKKEGHKFEEEDIAHLSPARHEHINPYGKYYFDVDKKFDKKILRVLRQP